MCIRNPILERFLAFFILISAFKGKVRLCIVVFGFEVALVAGPRVCAWPVSQRLSHKCSPLMLVRPVARMDAL